MEPVWEGWLLGPSPGHLLPCRHHLRPCRLCSSSECRVGTTLRSMQTPGLLAIAWSHLRTLYNVAESFSSQRQPTRHDGAHDGALGPSESYDEA